MLYSDRSDILFFSFQCKFDIKYFGTFASKIPIRCLISSLSYLPILFSNSSKSRSILKLLYLTDIFKLKTVMLILTIDHDKCSDQTLILTINYFSINLNPWLRITLDATDSFLIQVKIQNNILFQIASNKVSFHNNCKDHEKPSFHVLKITN